MTMRLFRHTIRIDRPREEVFDFFVDWEKGPTWRQYVTSMQRLDSGPLGAGSRVRFTVDLAGEETEYVLTVLAYERPALWRHSTDEAHFTGHVEYRFDDDGGGTRVTFSSVVRPKTLLGWLAMPQLWLARNRPYRDQLPQLKRALEGA